MPSLATGFESVASASSAIRARHGIAYMTYLLSILILGPRARWPVGKLFTTALAGVVPFLSFWMEHKRRREIEEEFQL